MWEIKEFKQMLTIELKDGTILNSGKSLQELNEYLSGTSMFCLIDWVIFNKLEMKKAYESKITSIEGFIMSQTSENAKRLRIREREKKAKIGRGFDSIGECERFLINNWLVDADTSEEVTSV